MPLHVDPAVEPKCHALALQQAALPSGLRRAGRRTEGAALLHNAVPGDARSLRCPVHGPTHNPGRARGTQQPGNLTVRRHLAPWDPLDQGVHTVEEAGAARPVESTCLRSTHSPSRASRQFRRRALLLVSGYLAKTPAMSTRWGSSGFCFPTTSASGVVTISPLMKPTSTPC